MMMVEMQTGLGIGDGMRNGTGMGIQIEISTGIWMGGCHEHCDTDEGRH